MLLCCYFHSIVCTEIFAWQQAGGTILLDADATSALHKRGILATNDNFKFLLFQVVYMSFAGII